MYISYKPLFYTYTRLNYFFLEINVRENRRGITNGQFRDTDNIGYTRHKTNKGKQKQTQHNTKN